VDLKEPSNHGKSRDTRFLDRVFTGDERRSIASSSRPDTVLWSLWAAKEAAYKLLSKTHPAISSIPRRYRAALTEGADGIHQLSCRITGCVATPSGAVSVTVTAADDYVHCVATYAFPEPPPFFSRVVALPNGADIPAESASQCVREAAVTAIAELLPHASPAISIRRFPVPGGFGPPLVFLDGLPSSIDLSLSHDGRFGALAMTFPAWCEPMQTGGEPYPLKA
jgi:phosphopantetheine--protein transferase-like protein